MNEATFFQTLKNNYDVNQPIFINEILNLFSVFSRAQVFRYIEKSKDNNDLVQYDTGVYFIPTSTLVGQSTITSDDVAYKKYISNNKKVYGVYTGIKLLNMFGVTTQMAGIVEIVSNKESSKKREISIAGRRYIVKKSKCKIDNSNFKAYMILELFNLLRADEVLPPHSLKLIKEYIIKEKITALQLLRVSAFFPSKALRLLFESRVSDGFIYDE